MRVRDGRTLRRGQILRDWDGDELLVESLGVWDGKEVVWMRYRTGRLTGAQHAEFVDEFTDPQNDKYPYYTDPIDDLIEAVDG